MLCRHMGSHLVNHRQKHQQQHSVAILAQAFLAQVPLLFKLHFTAVSDCGLFADPMVGYWCRVGSLALTHTRTVIFGAVAIWDQRRTMLRPPRDPSLLSWPWGSAPSGSGGPSSAVGLTSLPIVNSHAESAAMLLSVPVPGTMSFVPEVDEAEANSGSGSVSAQFEEKGSTGAVGAVPITDGTADGKVNKWNKNTLVWFPRSRRTLVLDKLLPAALSVSSAATELLPLPAATAVVQPACGPDPARLPFDATVGVAATDFEPASGPHPALVKRWIQFEEGLAKDVKEWEWVTVEEDEKEEKRLNSKPEKEHVTDLVGLSRLHGLEESSLMHWIFEFGEEEGLVRAIDEKLEKLSLETESVESEVPLQEEVLQVHPKISFQPMRVGVLWSGRGWRGYGWSAGFRSNRP